MNKAFSLVELLVVVIIIATVYTLVFNKSLTNILSTTPNTVELTNIKNALLENVTESGKQIDLVCSNEKMECFLFEDGIYKEKKLDLKQRITDYFIDRYDQATLKQHSKYIVDDIEFIPDFVYSIYPNRSNSDNLVELEDGTFAYFDPYFTQPIKLANSVEAIKYAHKFEYMPHQVGISND